MAEELDSLTEPPSSSQKFLGFTHFARKVLEQLGFPNCIHIAIGANTPFLHYHMHTQSSKHNTKRDISALFFFLLMFFLLLFIIPSVVMGTQ